MKKVSSRRRSGKQAPASQKKVVYRVKNWATYDKALVQRGSLKVWLREEAIDGWRYSGPTQRGVQFEYSDLSIETTLTFRTLFRLGLRHLVVDSVGLKVYGEGEWKTGQHGWTQRRTWRKLHLVIDADTGADAGRSGSFVWRRGL